MMEYLKKFNLTDEDLIEIKNSVDEMDLNEITMKEEKIETILKYFISIGITNIKDIIIYKTYLLYDDIDNIKDKINKYSNINIIKLINEDAINFDLIGL